MIIMREYCEVEIEIVAFDNEDVITSSCDEQSGEVCIVD